MKQGGVYRMLTYNLGLRINSDIIPFARAEGERNSVDDPNYHGSKAFFLKPEFNRLIRYQRFLVVLSKDQNG